MGRSSILDAHRDFIRQSLAHGVGRNGGGEGCGLHRRAPSGVAGGEVRRRVPPFWAGLPEGAGTQRLLRREAGGGGADFVGRERSEDRPAKLGAPPILAPSGSLAQGL